MPTDNELMDRLEKATNKLESLVSRLGSTSGSSGGGDEGGEAPSVSAWNDYYSAFVTPFVDTCKKLGVTQIAELAETGWKNIGDLMCAASVSKKPSQEELSKFIKPAADAIGKAQSSIDKRDPNFHHQAAFGELVSSLGWIMVAPAPQGMIQGQLEASDFYLQKVLFSKKDDPQKVDHRAFVSSAKAMLSEMKNYVKQFHTTGVVYKGKGNLADAGKAPAAGGASGPPPAASAPPPVAAAAAAPAASSGGGSSGGGGFGAVLSDIGKGSSVTSGLKKVTADMKTKNRKPGERSGLVKTAPKKAAATRTPATAAKVRPASTRLERGQHMLEFHQTGDVRVPEGASIKQNVYIFRCGECIVRVPEKVKAVTVDGCKKTRVIVNSVVSTVEVVNCQSVTIIVSGKVNSFAVDKTAGCQLWLSADTVAADPAIVTSNISEMNIQVPGADKDADPVEIPVPEQFLTKIKGTASDTKLITESVKHG
eukprot:662287_1